MSGEPRATNRASAKDRRAQAEQIGCADIVDALGSRNGHGAHIMGLERPSHGRVVFGTGVRIAFFARCAASVDTAVHDFGWVLGEAVGEEHEGKVLVLATNGHTELQLGGRQKGGARHTGV